MKRSTVVQSALFSAVAILLVAFSAFGAGTPAPIPPGVLPGVVIPASQPVTPAVAPAPFPAPLPAVTPAPALTTVASPNYRIVEEDLLRMDVWGEQQLSNIQMQVTPDGKINVPYVGAMQAAGLTQAELTEQIVKKLADAQILLDAKVQITIMTLHQPLVRVFGQVNRPGASPFKDGDKVMDAIATAGSYTDNAMLEASTLTHKGSDKPIPLDLRKLMDGDLSQNYELHNGDTIYVPPSDYQNKIYVLGQVARPGIYDLKKKTTVMSAIGLAGGPLERGALRSTVVVRGNPNKPERVPVNLSRLIDKADMTQDIALQSGDVVIVPETKRPDWNKVSTMLSTILSLTYIRRYGLF